MKRVIENEKLCIELFNELICSCGEAKDIAKVIDTLIFDYLDVFLSSGECSTADIAQMFFTMKELRNAFFKLGSDTEH